jgi:hypothetical protein
MKLPKFLFCENPIADKSDGRTFILHARKPAILAELFHFDQSENEKIMNCKRQFEIGSSLDYSPSEYIVLGTVWIEANTCSADELASIMRRMADWYEAYLIWEDNQGHNFEDEDENEDL